MAHARIVQDPKIMMGKPVIRYTRIPVEAVLRMLGEGRSIDTILDAYPGLMREDVHAAQAFAADYLASERILAAE